MNIKDKKWPEPYWVSKGLARKDAYLNELEGMVIIRAKGK